MSKLRADEFVNSDDNGAPSFPHSATVPAPTADDHFATKLYTDTSASTKSTSTTITNTISSTAPSNPSVGDFWTDTSESIIALSIWNGSFWVNAKNSLELPAGQIVTPPSISDPNGGYVPTMLTATSAVVSDATLSSSKWYKDDVEIPGATGLQYYATELGTYKYEETWVDVFGNQLFPSLSAVIDAYAGVIDAQPTISSSNGVYSPTTLTATAAVVSNATLIGSKWYKDGVEVPGETGLSINIPETEGGIYKYEEIWTDAFGTQLLPTLSASVQVFLTIGEPEVTGPTYNAGTPDFDFTGQSSAITNINQISGGWSSASFDSNGASNQWKSVAYGNGKYVALALIGNAYLAANSTDGINWTSYNTIPYTGYSHLAYGNGAFVAVGQNKIVYSTDEGESWSSASVSTNWWKGVTYGGGKFVAVAEDGTNRVATSSDGVNWSETSAPGNHMWLAVTYGGGKFVAVSQGGDAMYSSDGTNWSTTSVPETGVWNSVAYGNGKFVAVAGPKTMYSTDGINWFSGNNTVGYWKDITFGDGRFVAVSNYQDSNYPTAAGYSTDGDTWTPSNQAISGEWNGVDYVNGRFIAVAGTSTPKIMWSPTGVDEATELTLTDTTVSKVSDGTTIGGITIDEVLTIGEGVTSDITTSSTATVPVFSTDLWDGNNGTQTINTGIDLSNGDGMVWIKNRTSNWEPMIFDTELGPERYSITSGTQTYNRSNSGSGDNDTLSSFNSDGFDIGPMAAVNQSGEDYVSWTFRKAPGFFDVIHYTGDGTTNQEFSHSLGSMPGMVIIKNLSRNSDWFVWVDDNISTLEGTLNNYDDFGYNVIGTVTDTTVQTLYSNQTSTNRTGDDYVAYVFAADTPGLIKCGSYSSSGETVNLGFRPQWVMIKSVDNNAQYTGDWRVLDTARGIVNGDGDIQTWVNEVRAENVSSFAQVMSINDNGFTVESQGAYGSSTIYVAIAENAEADVTADVHALGTISASSGNTITLSDVSGTWSPGMKVEGMTLDTRDYEDAVNPASLSLTSSEPVVTQGLLTTWGNAQWQIAEDSGFTTNVQSYTSQLTASGTQAGPSEFNLDYEKDYFVRTKYGSSNPSNVFSDWSDPIPFRTGVNITYSVSHSATSVDEGSSVTFDVTTTGVDDGTVLYYSLGGSADGADVDGGLTGSLTINSNFGSATITITADQTTEGLENFVFQLRTDSTSGEVVYTSSTININDTSIEPAYLNTYLFKSPRDFKSSGSGWTVPTGVTHIWVSTVGAGGVGENYPNSYSGGNGGAGGYSRGVISVTAGETIIVAVGSHNNNGYGNDSYAPGGGFSGILRGPSSPSPNPSYTSLLIAGAGGGGQVNTNYAHSKSSGHAGAGGGPAGQHGSDNWEGGAYPAQGGTQSSGGNMSYKINPWGPSTYNSSSPRNGSYLKGGDGGSGGGGGGYYGGGGDDLGGHGGGAGGSGYVGGTLPFPSAGSYEPIRGTHQGSRRNVDYRMTNSPDYPLLGPNPISPQPWGHGGLGSNGPYPGRYSLGRGNGFVIIHCFKRAPGLSDFPTSFTVAGTY